MLITTIAAANYLAHTRVLARSFLDHHPDGRVVLLLLDGPSSVLREDEPFEVLMPEALGIEPAELRLMATIYDVRELATALKPFLLRHLLVDRGEPSVTYLDPDIEVLAPIDDIDELTRQHSIVLVPHRLWPPPDDDRTPSEHAFAQSGAFNLGFVAVAPTAAGFLDWWAGKCRRDCKLDVVRGMFFDQGWIDLAAVYFEHHVLRDPGCNVAYWNLDERPLALDGTTFSAGGAPLRFFHYSGFDPRAPHRLSRYAGDRPRVLMSEQPLLRQLCRGYADRLAGEGWEECRQLPYGLDRAANGMRIDPVIRQLWWDEVVRRERNLDVGEVEEMGDLFDPERVDAAVTFLSTPDPASDRPRISRYLLGLHGSRGELHREFSELTGLAGNHFMWWMREVGQRQVGFPVELAPLEDQLEPVEPAPPPSEAGVRVVGYLAAELGVGEAARGMVAALDALGEPHSAIVETGTASRQRHALHPTAPDSDRFDVNLVCVNADRFPVVLDRLGSGFTRDRWTIGMWAWEVEAFPASMAVAADLVDEVWTPSEHASAAVRSQVDKPVHTVPYPVVDRTPSNATRPQLGLPEGFVFLFCFDFFSVAERKNPFGIVEAFGRAFRPHEAHLVLKSINGHREIDELERLRMCASERPDVQVLDGYLDAADHHALVAACDAYVSLHRAEGFGLTMAEAMLRTKPVIATGYSGNLEFMDETNSFLVEHEMTTIPEGCAPYPAGSPWADPDLDHAAELMRRVVDDPRGSRAVAERGRRSIVESHSPMARAPLLAARLAASRAAACDRAAPAAAPAGRWLGRFRR